ncbi:MAG: FAD-binding oxidoreductase [Vicinamibacterales bacterium]
MDRDPERLASVLEDAAHYPGGHATGVARPCTVDEVAALVARTPRILAAGAQSSLTGGATPRGDLVLSTSRLSGLTMGEDHVVAGAGLTLQALQDALAPHGRWFPPVPTYLGATVGGAVSTNAAGAATFKYGSVRPWVTALTMVLADGSVLSLARGQVRAGADGFQLVSPDRRVTVSIAPLPLPEVPKCSAGYPLAAGMDAIDLFIGAEGTLGVVVEATLRVVPRPAAVAWALVPVRSEPEAIALVQALRQASRDTWSSGDPAGIDIAAIEHMDARSLAIAGEDGAFDRFDIHLPAGTGVVLLVQLELPEGDASRDLWAELADVRAPGVRDTPLVRFCRVLDAHGCLEEAEVALPHQERRAAQFAALREAVPSGVNRRVAVAQSSIDPRISKTAADMIVPMDRFGEMMRTCRALFEAAGLDLAVWGHISDGNVHPNLIPTSYADVERGREAILELGRAVTAMGGCPLAEHGVGRNDQKQRLLRELYGDSGLDAMRAVKRALDPEGRFGAGILWPAG